MVGAWVLVVLSSCGSGDSEPPPSCQNAIGNYYDAGCTFYDEAGFTFPQGDIVGACQEMKATAPTSCEDDLADWLFCLDGIEEGATSDADCDCTQEFDALLTCD